jgi:hypothetical protein
VIRSRIVLSVTPADHFNSTIVPRPFAPRRHMPVRICVNDSDGAALS